METILGFLSELKTNNTREWFAANKGWYDEANFIFGKLVTDVIQGISSFDKEVQLIAPKDCVFRIYRDVRFSKNKNPYKTNFGASFNKGGRNSRFGGYYLHIEPGKSFIGGGKWQPEADILKSIRYEIYQFPDEFKAIIGSKPFISRFGKLIEEKLQRPPKDFPSDFEDIELLKYKSYIFGTNVTDTQLTEKYYLPFAIETFQIMYPFIVFLNRAIAHL